MNKSKRVRFDALLIMINKMGEQKWKRLGLKCHGQ